MDHEVEIIPRIVKHPSLYFQDGNIILSVVDGHELHIFKCHKSVLARHSPVFAEMFEYVQEDYESEEYDGVPSVALQDAFEDVHALLTLLYDPVQMPYKKHDRDTATALHGPLRLATKFQMDSLRKRFISILQDDWPASLHTWDNNEAEVAKKLQEHVDGEQPLFPEPARVINLAKECNVPSLLPAAFYQLGRTFGPNQNPIEFAYNEVDTKLLSPEDWASLVHGRDQLRIAVTRFMHQFLMLRRKVGTRTSVCGQCPVDRPDAWGCKNYLKEWWIASCFEMLASEDILFIDPLEGLKKLSDMVSTIQTICAPCREWVQFQLVDQREQIWDSLPDYFNLNTFMVNGSSEI